MLDFKGISELFLSYLQSRNDSRICEIVDTCNNAVKF